MVNSCLGLFTATSSQRHPLFRSYGANMPSSLTTLLPLALGFSPHPPVSVYGTGAFRIHIPFLATASSCFLTIFQSLSPGATIARVRIPRCVSILNSFGGYGISTVCASATPSGLTLAPGLPWADEPAPRNLRLSAITILTQFSLLIPAFSLLCSPPLLSLRLHPAHNAPLPSKITAYASVIRLAPLNFRRSVTRPVSYYALF